MTGGTKRLQRTGLRKTWAGAAERRTLEAKARLVESSVRMLDEAAQSRGTRKRALPVAGLGLGLLTVLLSMVYQNTLAVNFTTGNHKMKLYSNYLDAQSAAGFLANVNRQNGTDSGVAELGIKSARLDGLCVIAKDNLLGGLALKITAGQPIPSTPYSGTAPPAGVETRTSDLDGPDAGTAVGDSPNEKAGALTGASLTKAITATQLYVNTEALAGYGNLISGLNLGQSAESVEATAGVDITQSAQTGGFGLYAQQLNVGGLNGDTYGMNLAGAITLPNLKLSVINKGWLTGSLDGVSQSDCS
jgi:hypothetical protein